MAAKRKKMVAKRNSNKKRGIFSKLFANKKLSALLFVVLFGAVGGVYIWRSSAAVDYRVGIANYGNQGYWVATASGDVLRYGDVGNHGSLKSKKITPAQPITDIAARRDGGGYWLLGGDGGVFAFGSAKHLGRAPEWGGAGYYKSIVSTPSGDGYWVISKLGTVYEFGDAKNTYKVSYAETDTNYKAVMGTIQGVDTIVDADHTASGKGLYMLDKTGKVWAAGQEAKNNVKAKVTMVDGESASGIAANNTNGYLIVTTKGGVQAHGSEVEYKGGMFGKPFEGKMVGITKIGGAAGHPIGYWLVASDGGVFAYGSATFRGATPIDINNPCDKDIVNNITFLQQCLNKLGANPRLAEDGKLGDLTRKACSNILKGFCPHPYVAPATGGGGGTGGGTQTPPSAGATQEQKCVYVKSLWSAVQGSLSAKSGILSNMYGKGGTWSGHLYSYNTALGYVYRVDGWRNAIRDNGKITIGRTGPVSCGSLSAINVNNASTAYRNAISQLESLGRYLRDWAEDYLKEVSHGGGWEYN